MPRLAAVSFVLCVVAVAPARADPCAPIVAAYEKLADAPAYRQVITAFGQPPAEAVAIGDRLFMKEGGEWDSLELQPGARREMMQAVVGQAGGLKNCVAKPGASLEGRAMKVFAYEPPEMEGQPKGGVQTLWVEAATGLPRRMEADAMEMVISYEGVTAPKVP